MTKQYYKLLTIINTIVNILNCIMLVTLVCVGYRTGKYIVDNDIDKAIERIVEFDMNEINSQIEHSIESRLNEQLTKQITQQMLDEWNAAHDTDVSIEDITDPQPEVEVTEPVLAELISDTNNVTKISNATPQELNRAIQKSCKWLYEYNQNIGQLYYELEHKHGINAYFALAVSISEVGAQEMSKLAREDNNTYGLMTGVKYDSIEDCTDYFFRLIKKYYVGQGRLSVEDISQMYCLGNPEWINNVSFYMRALPNRSR